MGLISKFALAVTFICLAISSSNQVEAFPQSRVGFNPASNHVAFIAEKGRTVGPFAHVLFCKTNPEDCRTKRRTRWGRAPVMLTAVKQKQLQSVNLSINAAITPRNDGAASDTWSLAPTSGDCEDYAITKRHKLIGMGWPASAVRLAVTLTGAGQGHMVLVVRTNHGDLVLDNRFDKIRLWNKTGLKWKMIQASVDPWQWERI